MPKIELKNVYKIFGEDPQSVLPLLQEGTTKEEILEERVKNSLVLPLKIPNNYKANQSK